MILLKYFVKVTKLRIVFVNLHRFFFTKVFLSVQINGPKNITSQFSVKIISNKMHETTFKLVLTQEQFVNSHTELLQQIINLQRKGLLSLY